MTRVHAILIGAALPFVFLAGVLMGVGAVTLALELP